MEESQNLNKIRETYCNTSYIIAAFVKIKIRYSYCLYKEILKELFKMKIINMFTQRQWVGTKWKQTEVGGRFLIVYFFLIFQYLKYIKTLTSQTLNEKNYYLAQINPSLNVDYYFICMTVLEWVDLVDQFMWHSIIMKKNTHTVGIFVIAKNKDKLPWGVHVVDALISRLIYWGYHF